jgi:hypothetical protein
MLKSMNDPNDQCEWLETKKQEMLRWDDEFIEQAAEEYAALLGREGEDYEKDKQYAIEYLHG